MPSYPLVLLRHGESLWNAENRFSGWVDVDLSSNGEREAQAAGRYLKQSGYRFDMAYTSLLKRAIRTLWLTLEELDQCWLPTTKSWRLNERHYGALQGLNKADTAARYGAEKVLLWRRSYEVLPPPLAADDRQHPRHDTRYRKQATTLLPSSESLSAVVTRITPIWQEQIKVVLRAGASPLIVAHGNTLRALVMLIEDLSPEQIMAVNIPTGTPLVYQLDRDFKATSKQYLGDPEAIRQATEAVIRQGQSR